MAAACGGVTTICDYAWQARGQTLTSAVEAWKAKAAGRAHIDYGFHGHRQRRERAHAGRDPRSSTSAIRASRSS